MFCSWGSETKLQPLGQVKEMCPNCNRETVFTCYNVIEQDNICYVPCGSNSKGRFAQCNVCGIRFDISHIQIDNPSSQTHSIPQSHSESTPSPRQNAEMLYESAKKMYQYNRFEDALTNINASLDLLPSNADYWNLRGVILANTERFEEALLSFERAYELDKNDPSILKNKELCNKKLRERR